MESDINPSEGMGISIHKATDTLILQEEFGELSENPNVMLMDMDVVKGESSGFVQVVKQGEKLVPDERKGENTSK